MQTRLEAPAQEPRNVLGPDGEIRLAGVSRAFARRHAAPVPALADVTLHRRRRGDRRRRRPERLRQDHAARARLRSAVAGHRHGAVRPRGAHAPARPPAALDDRDRQRRARAAGRRGEPRQARASARTRCSPPSAWRASSAPARTSCRAACASASRSCARCSPASPCSASTSRSAPSTRSPAARCRSGWRAPSAASPGRSCSSPTTSRRRRCSPTGSSCSRRGRGASSRSFRSALERPRSATDPALVALRERALEALRA